jgi:hypothetical protein
LVSNFCRQAEQVWSYLLLIFVEKLSCIKMWQTINGINNFVTFCTILWECTKYLKYMVFENALDKHFLINILIWYYFDIIPIFLGLMHCNRDCQMIYKYTLSTNHYIWITKQWGFHSVSYKELKNNVQKPVTSHASSFIFYHRALG